MKQIAVILLWLSACQAPQVTEELRNQYIDLPKLANQLIVQQTQHPQPVLKLSSINAQFDTLQITQPDSLFWAETLNLLLATQLNKPALTGAFEVSEPQPDPNSNLLTTTYRLKAAQQSNIKLVTLKYLNSPDNLRYLTLKIASQNPVYATEQALELWLNGLPNTSHLSIDSLRIKGSNKTIFLDSVHYQTVVVSTQF